MRRTRTLTLLALLVATVLLAGCTRCRCGWDNAARWWDPSCSGTNCAPLGDPCDCCDPRG